MTLALDVIAFRERGQAGSAISELLRVPKDDFRTIVVLVDCAHDRKLTALQLPDITERMKIGAEYDHCEWAGMEVGTEVEKGYAVMSLLHTYDRAFDALLFSDMLASFGDGEAVLRLVLVRRGIAEIRIAEGVRTRMFSVTYNARHQKKRNG